MRWIEVSLDTPAESIDSRCDALAAMGAEGFVIENEADFQEFLDNNHQYWDYVDEDLEQQYSGVSRVKFYLSDDEEGQKLLETVRQAGFDNVAYQKVGNIIRVVLRDIDEADLDKFQSRLDEGGFSSYIIRERKNIIRKD